MEKLQKLKGITKGITVSIKTIETYELINFCAFIIFVFFWSVIDILLMYNMQESVFDAGIISLTMKSLLYYHYFAYVKYMIGFSLLRILFSPLILIDGIAGMLIIQEIFLGLPSLIIYKIAKNYTHDGLSSMLISISYLLYFPLAGVNYYDFHFQAFFIFLFLMGFYLFTKEKYISSSIFLFLSGVVRFPYLVFPAILMVLILLTGIYNKLFKNKKMDRKIFNYSVVNFLIFVIFLSVSYFLIFKSPYYLAQKGSLGGYFHISSGNPLDIFFQNIDNKVITIVLIFSPLLFIPIKSWKWMIFLTPFIMISFFNNYNVYIYPGFYHYQYTVTLAPFLYIGLIESIRINDATDPKEGAKGRKTRLFHKLVMEVKRRKQPISVFIAVVLFALVFQPYSPVNRYSSNPFNMNILHPDIQQYDNYVNVTDLIPSDCSRVIYQNDLPYLDVHDPALSCLEAFNTIFGYNKNLTIELQNLTFTNNIQYALGFSQGFSTGPYLTMCESMNKLFKSGNYGIEAFQDGMVLLKKGYHDKPVYYNPINQQEKCFSLETGGHNTSLHFYTTMLIPGTYMLNITFPEFAQRVNINNFSLNSQVLKTTINTTEISASNVGKTYVEHLRFSLNYFYSNPVITFNLPIYDANKLFNLTLFGPDNL